MQAINQKLLKSVTGAYQLISHELSRPKEDVVGISVCGTTKSAIEKVLTLYLESKGIKNPEAETMNELMNLCIRKNKKFQQFDISTLSCRCESSKDNSLSYCLGVEKINSCYSLLVEIKDFVFKELKISEKTLVE